MGFNPKGRLHQLFQPRRGSRLPGPYGRTGPEQRGGHVPPPSHRAGHGHIPRPLSRIRKAGNRPQERGEGVSLRRAVSPQFRAQRRRHIPPQMQDPVVEQIQKLLKCRVPGPHPLPHQQGHMRRQRPIHARQPKQIHIKARSPALREGHAADHPSRDDVRSRDAPVHAAFPCLKNRTRLPDVETPRRGPEARQGIAV